MSAFGRPLAGLVGLCLMAMTASASDVTELRFAVQTPPQVHYNKELFVPWAEKVSADSQGTLTVKMFFAGTLGKEGQLVDIVESGAADIALDVASYYSGRFALTEVASLPLLITDAKSGSEALWSAYEKGAFGHEFDGLKMLAITTPPAATVLTVDKAVSKPADLQGMKIAGGGKTKGQMISAVGAAPIEVKIAELYQALSRKLVDGAITYYTAFAPFKLHEVGKHALDLPLGGSMMIVFMTQEKFDALPPEAQQAIEMNSGAQFSSDFGVVWDRANSVGKQMLADGGGEISQPSAEELAEWEAAFEPILNDWAGSVEGGDATLATLRAELKTTK